MEKIEIVSRGCVTACGLLVLAVGIVQIFKDGEDIKAFVLAAAFLEVIAGSAAIVLAMGVL